MCPPLRTLRLTHVRRSKIYCTLCQVVARQSHGASFPGMITWGGDLTAGIFAAGVSRQLLVPTPHFVRDKRSSWADVAYARQDVRKDEPICQ
jgi:hypothetical protein